jgi:oligopeptide transport system ATP-binding protein
MKEYLLEIKNEKLSFFTQAGEVKALDDVSLKLREGEVLGIVGESGSGKSVTAYSLLGLTSHPGRIIGGSINFDGHSVEKMSDKEMRRLRGKEISIIFQDPMTSLNPVYTIGNQIREVIRLHTGKSRVLANARAKELLTLVGINDPQKRIKQYPHELSGGMRQRVMIAIALACEPKLLIADEPTTALDVTIQAQIIELMIELKKKIGMAIILITHDLGVVASICEKIAVMYAGKVVEYGTTDEIFYSPSHEYTRGLLNSIPRLDDKEHTRLIPIEGVPVDMLNPPAGCSFSPRCDCCMKICLRQMPEETWLSETHYSRCWLLQGDSGRESRMDNGKESRVDNRMKSSTGNGMESRVDNRMKSGRKVDL